MLVFSDIFRQDSRSVPRSHYSVGKIVDQISDVLWSKLSKHLTDPDHDRFRTQLLIFKIDGIFLTLSAV
jgi:hypothetical protein